MNWTPEVVVVPVSDVDRAKAFYAEGSASTWTTTRETAMESSVVQLTPPGSGCSIVVTKPAVGAMSGIADMQPGSLKGLQPAVVRYVQEPESGRLGG